MPARPTERLLRHLHAHGIPFCLATSSHLRHYNLKTTLHGDLFALFNHRVTGARQPGSACVPACKLTWLCWLCTPAWFALLEHQAASAIGLVAEVNELLPSLPPNLRPSFLPAPCCR